MSWIEPQTVPNQTSKASPIIGAIDDLVHMVHLGDRSNDIWWSIYDGTSWKKPDGTPGNVRIPGQKSKAPPALAAFQNQLHMVHLGDRSNDIWWSIYDGTSWKKPDGTPGNVRIPGQKSKAPPALAAFGGSLYLVHLGDTSNDIWWSAYDGTSWRGSDGTPGDERIVDQRSKASPAIVGHHLVLHMVHLGDTSNNIWHSTKQQPAIEWTPNRLVGQSSRARPSMAATFTQQGASALHMVYLSSLGKAILHSLFVD